MHNHLPHPPSSPHQPLIPLHRVLHLIHPFHHDATQLPPLHEPHHLPQRLRAHAAGEEGRRALRDTSQPDGPEGFEADVEEPAERTEEGEGVRRRRGVRQRQVAGEEEGAVAPQVGWGTGPEVRVRAGDVDYRVELGLLVVLDEVGRGGRVARVVDGFVRAEGADGRGARSGAGADHAAVGADDRARDLGQ